MPLIRLPRPLAATVTVIALAISCAGFLTACSGSSNENKPDLLLVIVDDQRADTMEVVPAVRASFPVVFRNGFATTPNCCPSRSSILSGEYAHTTGVKHNGYVEVWQDREEDTLGPWLQEQGYYTGFVGKYFNQYSRDDHIPVGWDEFYGLAYDVGDRTRTVGLREGFRDAEGDEHDELAVYPDAEHPALYPTTIFSRLAERFLDHAASEAFNPDGKPFALVLSTTVPNTRRIPPRYARAPLPRWHQPPSFMEPDMSDKPLEIRESHRVVTKPSQAAAVRARQLRELMTVNDAVKAVWARIARYGWRRHTWGIYFSDNGRSEEHTSELQSH